MNLRFWQWVALGAVWGATYLLAATPYCAPLGILSSLGLALLLERNPRPRLLEFTLLGFSGLTIAFYWVGSVLGFFLEVSEAMAYLLMALLIAYLTLQFFLTAVLYRILQRSPRLDKVSLALPLAWLSIEVLFPKPMPWIWGYTQLENPLIAQLASLAGAPLISFALLWWSVLLVRILCKLLAGSVAQTVLPSSLLVISFSLALLYSRSQLAEIEKLNSSEKAFRIGIVQGNNPPLQLYEEQLSMEYLKKYLRLTQQLPQESLDLMIWPETSVLKPIWNDEKYVATDFGLGGERIKAPLIFGGQTYVKDAQIEGFYNSAVALSSNGLVAGVYNKDLPFPVAEELPFEHSLGWFYRLIGRNPKDTKILRGLKTDPLILPNRNSRESLGVAGVSICYEVMFPERLAQLARESKLLLLLELSNLSWFKETAALRQHHLLSAWRAIELRRYLVRATNTGLTMIIDPAGRVVDRAPAFREATLTSDSVRLISTVTIYQQYGEQLLGLVAYLILVLAGVSYFESRMRSSY